MKGRKYTSGRVFTIPLLHGGYAFGVITFNDDGLGMFCNIYDHYEETDEPPLDITTKPIVVFDLLMGSEFHLKPSDGLGGGHACHLGVVARMRPSPQCASNVSIAGGAAAVRHL